MLRHTKQFAFIISILISLYPITSYALVESSDGDPDPYFLHRNIVHYNEVVGLSELCYWYEDHGIYYLAENTALRYLDLLDNTDLLHRLPTVLDGSDKKQSISYEEGICQYDLVARELLLITKDLDERINIDILGIANDYLSLYMEDICVDSNFVCILFSNGNDSVLYIQARGADNGHTVDIQNIENIASFKDGEMLLQIDGSLYAYDLKTGTLRDKMVTADVFEYSALTNQLLFVSGGNIYRICDDDFQPTLVFITPYMKEGKHNNAYCKMPIQSLYALDDNSLIFASGNRLYLAKAEATSNTLRVHWYDGPFTRKVQLERYLAVNPYIELERTYFDDPNAVPDVFTATNEGNLDIWSLQKRENMMDLSFSDVICSQYDSYIPQVQEAVSYKTGAPFAVPTGFELHLWYYLTYMRSEFGFPPFPTTSDEYIELINAWLHKYRQNNESSVLHSLDLKTGLIFELKNQYIYEQDSGAAPVRFDTPAFRDMINRVLSLPSGEYGFAEKNNTLLYSTDDFGKPLWATISQINNNEDESAISCQFLLPPIVSGIAEHRIGARIEAETILIAAENKRLAVDYLEYCAANPTIGQSDLAYMLTLDINEAPAFDEKMFEMYHEMVPYITLHINALGGTPGVPDMLFDFVEAFAEETNLERHSDIQVRTENLIQSLTSGAEHRFYYDEYSIPWM